MKPENNNKLTSTPSIFLFTWNPKKWKWDIQKAIQEHQRLGRFQRRWTCASHRSAKPGDRAFMILVGSENNGIFGSGFVISKPAKGFTEEGKQGYFIQIDFEILFNPLIEDLLPAKTLSNNFETQVWSPQSSGISIKEEYISGLEQTWFEFLQTKGKVFNSFEIDSDDEDEIFIEGASSKIISSRYERNLKARTRCIEFHGVSCVVCDINFLEAYGEIGKGFIHVHHLTTLAHMGGKSYSVNPINDLRPVCPNCHAMLHTSNPPYNLSSILK